jgi:hypothetical protein
VNSITKPNPRLPRARILTKQQLCDTGTGYVRDYLKQVKGAPMINRRLGLLSLRNLGCARLGGSRSGHERGLAEAGFDAGVNHSSLNLHDGGCTARL